MNKLVGQPVNVTSPDNLLGVIRTTLEEHPSYAKAISLIGQYVGPP